jgi:hypothetical protein
MLCTVACGARTAIDSQESLQSDAEGASDAATIETDFPGIYACTSSITSVYRTTGMTFTYAGGRSGTLHVTRDGVALTASYGGDPSANGSLTFAATSHGSADPIDALQSLQVVACIQQKDVENTLDIGSGSLTRDGSAVILSLAGTMNASSACPGAEVVVSLTCETVTH